MYATVVAGDRVRNSRRLCWCTQQSLLVLVYATVVAGDGDDVLLCYVNKSLHVIIPFVSPGEKFLL